MTCPACSGDTKGLVHVLGCALPPTRGQPPVAPGEETYRYTVRLGATLTDELNAFAEERGLYRARDDERFPATSTAIRVVLEEWAAAR